MDDAILFDTGDIVVTKSVVRVDATSYQVSTISSVAVLQSTKMNRIAVFFMLAGVALAIAAIFVAYAGPGPLTPLAPERQREYALWIGLGAATVFALGAVLQRLRPALEYMLVMRTTAGETRQVKTWDRTKAFDLKIAIENAFMVRARSTLSNEP